MIKKYKIGNFTIEIKSSAVFENAEPYSLFSYDGEQTDYSVTVEFSSRISQKTENPCFVSQDRVCEYENGVLRSYFKSHDNDDEFYACRTDEGKNISIVIDEKYHDMLRADVIFSLIGIEEIAVGSNGLCSAFIVY